MCGQRIEDFSTQQNYWKKIHKKILKINVNVMQRWNNKKIPSLLFAIYAINTMIEILVSFYIKNVKNVNWPGNVRVAPLIKQLKIRMEEKNY